MSYKISVVGCDDTTSIDIELTESEFILIEKIAAQITSASSYGCMPRMGVKLNDPNTHKEKD